MKFTEHEKNLLKSSFGLYTNDVIRNSRRKSPPITDEEGEKMVALYIEGNSIAKVAGLTDRSPAGIQKWFKNNGFDPRACRKLGEKYVWTK